MNRSVAKISADDAIERCGKLAMDKEELLTEIEKSQDERFKDIRSLSFGWIEQPGSGDTKKEKKLMSMLPNGKVVFIDRSQDLTDIIAEDPYICLIYERQREAFAKILFPEYQPHIYIRPTKMVSIVWRSDKGKVHSELMVADTYEKRLLKAIKEMELKKFEQVKIVFRKA